MHLKSALFWLLLSLPVAAQDEGGPVAHPEASQSAEQASPSSPSRPYSQSVQQAFFASGLKSAKPVLRVEYDAAGVPVKLALKPASGDQALDEAILEWGRQLRLPPGKAGKGRLPFDLSSEKAEPPQTPYGANIMRIDFEGRVVKAPSFDPVLRTFGGTNLSRASTELLIDYDIDGNVVDVRLTKPTLSGALDKAMLKWAKRLKFKAGSAGSWRLPMNFEIR